MLKMFFKSFYIKHFKNKFSNNKENVWISRGDKEKSLEINNAYFNKINESRSKFQLLLQSFPIRNVFEFGCNSGHNANYLLKYQIDNYVGLDINNDALNYARKAIKNKNFRFINWDVLNKKNENFFIKFDTFISLYSLAYLNKRDIIALLRRFYKSKYFIIGEPENNLKSSFFLHSTPEFSHDYEDIFQTLDKNFVSLRLKLDRPDYNLKNILVFIKG